MVSHMMHHVIPPHLHHRTRHRMLRDGAVRFRFVDIRFFTLCHTPIRSRVVELAQQLVHGYQPPQVVVIHEVQLLDCLLQGYTAWVLIRTDALPPPKSASRRNEPHSYCIPLLARSALGRGLGRASHPPGKASVLRNLLLSYDRAHTV